MSKNSRRTRPTRHPQTIDLEAEDVTATETQDEETSHPSQDETTDSPAVEQASGDEFQKEAVQDDASQDMPSDPVEELPEASEAPEPISEMAAQSEPEVENADAGPLQSSISEDEKNPPSPVAPPVEPRSSSSSGGWIGAGIAGAVMGAAAAGALLFVVAPKNDAATRIDALEQKLSAAPASGTDMLDKRLSALEKQAATPMTSAGTDALDKRLAALETAKAGLLAQVQDEQAKIAAIRMDLEKVSANTGSRDAAASVAALSAKVETLASGMADKAKSVSSVQALGTLVLANRLEGLFDNGRPYAAVLDAVGPSGLPASDLDALKVFAASGAPSVRVLIRDFAPVSTALMQQQQTGKGDWSDTLWDVAGKMVTIKPVDDPGGMGIPALVVRIEKALERNDLQSALKAFEDLPEAPRVVVANDWGRKLAQVAAASKAVRDFADRAARNYHAETAQSR